MQIESIEIKNYRLFRSVLLNNLPRMAVVVGANGSGKTTLFDVFSFLKDALTENVAAAVARRGGFRELVSRDSAGPIELTIVNADGDLTHDRRSGIDPPPLLSVTAGLELTGRSGYYWASPN